MSFGTDRLAMSESREAADVLIRHLFASAERAIAGIEYGSHYRLAIGRSGGDIVDAFPLGDGSILLVVADISGKGSEASVHAAVVKYALRGYASAGMSPAKSLDHLDRLFKETVQFEQSDLFATVFAARIAPDRRTLRYASAGHDVVAIKQPGAGAAVLEVTGGAVGILPHFVAEDRRCALSAGSLIVLGTDGLTEARSNDDFFGVDGFLAAIDRYADGLVSQISPRISEDALDFANGDAHDDSAILAIRCLP